MKAALQQKIKPYAAPQGKTFNELKVDDQTGKKVGKGNEIDFKSLLTNSNEAKKQERIKDAAKDYSDLSQEEFLQKLSEESKPKREAKNKLDKDDFMKLFVEQLKNQDPLNPDKGAEMAAKLAQFNSLEQQMNSNKSLDALLKSQEQDRSLAMLNYVGKEVNLDGGFLRVKDGAVLPQTFTTPLNVASAKLIVTNQSGVKQAEIDLGSLKAGDHEVKWDGKTKSGELVAPGVYKYKIDARSIQNQPLDIPLTTSTKITGIDLKDAEQGLYTEYGKIGISEIKAVGVNGFSAARAQLGTVAGEAEQGDGTSAAKAAETGSQATQSAKENQAAADEGQQQASEDAQKIAAERAAKMQAAQKLAAQRAAMAQAAANYAKANPDASQQPKMPLQPQGPSEAAIRAQATLPPGA